jgi:oligoendopeptidase F
LYKVSQSGKVDDFADKYLDMLSKTALEDYDKILKPFGLNPNGAEFWEYGLSLISSYIDRLEELDKKINK